MVISVAVSWTCGPEKSCLELSVEKYTDVLPYQNFCLVLSGSLRGGTHAFWLDQEIVDLTKSMWLHGDYLCFSYNDLLLLPACVSEYCDIRALILANKSVKNSWRLAERKYKEKEYKISFKSCKSNLSFL